jgi:hypothetical protein
LEQAVDITEDDTIVHISIDHTHMQTHERIKWLMLEQMIFDTYEDVDVVKNTNQYGLLTDMRIQFKDANDATHFKLRFN